MASKLNSIVISIGDELLSGHTVNTNAAWLGTQLGKAGYEYSRQITIRDEVDDIVAELNAINNKYDLIITTGGLGPTKDDKTNIALQQFMGTELKYEESVYEKMRVRAEKRGYTLTELHKEQCYFPEGVELLRNDLGTAPGVVIRSEKSTIISLPGVPYEMKHLFSDRVLPLLIHEGLKPNISHTFSTAGMGETRIYELLKDIEADFPPGYQLAFLPSAGLVRVQLKAPSYVEKADLEPFLHRMREAMGPIVFSESGQSLSEALGELLVRHSETLSLCESCTGGNVSKKIVSRPGASRYYVGGFVSYANDFKANVVGVNPDTIEAHGAVSEETVIEMLERTLTLSRADYGIAISGVAGPDGGTEDKPVGTFWISFGSKDDIRTKLITLMKDRKVNISYVSNFALNALRNYILNKKLYGSH